MATNKKRIQAYVSLSIYESLKSQAEARGISLSELASEVLQTQSVSGGETNAISDGVSFVTKEQLSSVLSEFRREMERQIVREVNKAELQWEANANTLVGFQQSALELMSSPEAMKNALAKYEKRKKK